MVVQLHPDIFFLSSEEYDFTLVSIKAEDINSLFTKLAIQPLQLKRISHRDVYNVKTVQIAQYAEGKSKWLSIGRVYEIQAKYILYNADTTGGCSGSPVFYACNEDCYVIAIHKSGGVVTSSSKESVNKGVFINHIFDRLYGDPVQPLQPESKPTFSPQEIGRIARRLSSKWEKIALALSNIRKNPNHEDNVLKAIAMLGDYQKRRGTKEGLASALEEFGELDLAEKVQTYFDDMQPGVGDKVLQAMSGDKDEILAGRGGDVVCWHKMVEAINAVCQLTIIDGPGTTGTNERKGSGSLVRLKLDGNIVSAILTNHHVIKNEEMAAKTSITFNYDGKGEPMVINLYPDIFFRTSQDYDFTLVGLKPDDINSLHTKLDILPLRLQRIPEHDLYNVKIVQIAQHPQGKPKRFSMGRVCEIQEKYILYDADTTAGSSGSPVFHVRNKDCCVLALHKSGGVVTSSCKQPVNKGVFINIILDHLSGGPVKFMQPTEDKVKFTESKQAGFTPQETVRIGSRIPDKWEMIALATGKFNDKETAIIRLNHNYHDNAMKATTMLSDYQRRLGTRENLASALKEFGELDLAEKVQSKYFQTQKCKS